jgi:hypothetical protein
MFLSFHPLSLESIVSPSVLAHFESRLLGSVGVFGFGWTRAAYIVTHRVTEIVIISGWDVSRPYTTQCFKSCPPKVVSSYCVLNWYGVDSQYANPLQLSPKKKHQRSRSPQIQSIQQAELQLATLTASSRSVIYHIKKTFISIIFAFILTL